MLACDFGSDGWRCVVKRCAEQHLSECRWLNGRHKCVQFNLITILMAIVWLMMVMHRLLRLFLHLFASSTSQADNENVVNSRLIANVLLTFFFLIFFVCNSVVVVSFFLSLHETAALAFIQFVYP